ncbi:hypothetical protein Droror1_Dr00005501 [Drosera rotundifolia]
MGLGDQSVRLIEQRLLGRQTRFFAECNLKWAMTVFRPSTDSFFSLDKKLKDLCYAGSLREAVRLLAGSGFTVEWRTCSLLLQECIHRKEYELGRRLHVQMIVIGFALNEYLKTKLLILYAKAGLLVTAGEPAVHRHC